MARFLHPIKSLTVRKRPQWYLAFSWLLGLVTGGLVFRYTGETIASLMPYAAVSQLSMVSLFLRSCLPFLLCSFAVLLGKPGLVLLICFFRAFFYAYVLGAVFVSFGNCGWLIRWLLLFTDSFVCTLLLGFGLRYVSGLRQFRTGDLGFCGVCIAVLVSLDYFYVSPFLRQLLL